MRVIFGSGFIPRIAATVLHGLLILTLPAFAQSVGAPTAETLEEIVVKARKPLLHLRNEVYRAEDDFYAKFNALNDDDDYDVSCVKEAATGTRIRERVCRSRVEEALLAQHARALVRDGDAPSVAGAILHRKAILLERMKKMALENDTLKASLAEFYNAKYIYETEKMKRCEDRLLICDPGF